MALSAGVVLGGSRTINVTNPHGKVGSDSMTTSSLVRVVGQLKGRHFSCPPLGVNARLRTYDNVPIQRID